MRIWKKKYKFWHVRLKKQETYKDIVCQQQRND